MWLGVVDVMVGLLNAVRIQLIYSKTCRSVVGGVGDEEKRGRSVMTVIC